MTRPEAVLSSEPAFKITKPIPRKLTPAQLKRTLTNKRCKTLIGKSDQLSKLGARVYMVIEVNSRYHVYSSESSESWPPTEASLERNYPVPIRYRPQNTQSQCPMENGALEEEEEEERTPSP
ncbi:hypothetical protein B0T10DRAFT_418299 [Thelonectria olida]|uniref:MADS-box domain-containing protein n=1 Tax=Thelonectria olida TaxID=1576542 RepID=A0A9P8VP03_9HYPO|nr:hypothetical protein B0T10DRAFT_418299 [Thelonectria olida]